MGGPGANAVNLQGQLPVVQQPLGPGDLRTDQPTNPAVAATLPCRQFHLLLGLTRHFGGFLWIPHCYNFGQINQSLYSCNKTFTVKTTAGTFQQFCNWIDGQRTENWHLIHNRESRGPLELSAARFITPNMKIWPAYQGVQTKITHVQRCIHFR